MHFEREIQENLNFFKTLVGVGKILRVRMTLVMGRMNE